MTPEIIRLPSDINPSEVRTFLEQLHRVDRSTAGAHDVHIWAMSTTESRACWPRAAFPSAASACDNSVETANAATAIETGRSIIAFIFAPTTYRGRALPSYMNVIGFGPGI
jgi:hypothetical protein